MSLPPLPFPSQLSIFAPSSTVNLIMEKEETMAQGSVKDFECLVKQLKDTLNQFLNGEHTACFDISCVNHILSDIQKLIRVSDEEAKNEYAIYLGSQTEILDVWYKFQNWQLSCKFYRSLYSHCSIRNRKLALLAIMNPITECGDAKFNLLKPPLETLTWKEDNSRALYFTFAPLSVIPVLWRTV